MGIVLLISPINLSRVRIENAEKSNPFPDAPGKNVPDTFRFRDLFDARVRDFQYRYCHLCDWHPCLLGRYNKSFHEHPRVADEEP